MLCTVKILRVCRNSLQKLNRYSLHYLKNWTEFIFPYIYRNILTMSNTIIYTCKERGRGHRKDYTQKYILHVYGSSFLPTLCLWKLCLCKLSAKQARANCSLRMERMVFKDESIVSRFTTVLAFVVFLGEL